MDLNRCAQQIQSYHDLRQFQDVFPDENIEYGLTRPEDEQVFFTSSIAFLQKQLLKRLNEEEDEQSCITQDSNQTSFLILDVNDGREIYIDVKNAENFEETLRRESTIPKNKLSFVQMIPKARKPRNKFTLRKMFFRRSSRKFLKNIRSFPGGRNGHSDDAIKNKKPEWVDLGKDVEAKSSLGNSRLEVMSNLEEPFQVDRILQMEGTFKSLQTVPRKPANIPAHLSLPKDIQVKQYFNNFDKSTNVKSYQIDSRLEINRTVQIKNNFPESKTPIQVNISTQTNSNICFNERPDSFQIAGIELPLSNIYKNQICTNETTKRSPNQTHSKKFSFTLFKYFKKSKKCIIPKPPQALPTKKLNVVDRFFSSMPSKFSLLTAFESKSVPTEVSQTCQENCVSTEQKPVVRRQDSDCSLYSGISNKTDLLAIKSLGKTSYNPNGRLYDLQKFHKTVDRRKVKKDDICSLENCVPTTTVNSSKGKLKKNQSKLSICCEEEFDSDEDNEEYVIYERNQSSQFEMTRSSSFQVFSSYTNLTDELKSNFSPNMLDAIVSRLLRDLEMARDSLEVEG